MKNESQMLLETISKIIGSGELIQRNIRKENAEREFLTWASKVKHVIEELIDDKFIKFEAKNIISKDISNVNSIGSKELPGKLDRIGSTPLFRTI